MEILHNTSDTRALRSRGTDRLQQRTLAASGLKLPPVSVWHEESCSLGKQVWYRSPIFALQQSASRPTPDIE
jgi:hypothetical protein